MIKYSERTQEGFYSKGERYNSFYPGLNDESGLLIRWKSANPGLMTIVPFPPNILLKANGT